MRRSGCAVLGVIRLSSRAFVFCFLLVGCAVPPEEQAAFNAKMERLGAAVGDLRVPQPVCVVYRDSTLSGERTALGGTYYAPSGRGPLQRRCYAQPR